MEPNIAFSFFLFTLLATLLATFGVVATGLAALGLYGVMALSVAQRTREMGVRLSLGASARDIAALILGQGMALVAGGLGEGLVMTLGLSRLVASQLVGISPFDPAAYAVTTLTVVIVAATACALPARAALRLDPLAALRTE